MIILERIAWVIAMIVVAVMSYKDGYNKAVDRETSFRTELMIEKEASSEREI